MCQLVTVELFHLVYVLQTRARRVRVYIMRSSLVFQRTVKQQQNGKLDAFDTWNGNANWTALSRQTSQIRKHGWVGLDRQIPIAPETT